MPITTARLELIPLTRDYLARTLAGEPTPDRGFIDPHGFLADAADVVELRLAQLDREPTIESWLMRALVLRDEHVAIGFAGFHAAPDERGIVELGYEILPAFRRRGYASEAVPALLAWAANRGANVVRASVAPSNAASIALLERLAFRHVGERLDEVDGRELVFEKLLR